MSADGPGERPGEHRWDVFISHASEDKARFVEPLVGALKGRGLTVWYDAHQLCLGDHLHAKIDEGLRGARFGVVVVSDSFFKDWLAKELAALFNQEAVTGQKRILPVRCGIDHATLTVRSPLLAGRVSVGWELGVEAVADRIVDAVRALPLGAGGAAVQRTRKYNLPSRRAGVLFGRDNDLARLDALLVPGRDVQVAAAIEGLAGVGKTELAHHLVDRLAARGRFPGGIFWLDAADPDLTLA